MRYLFVLMTLFSVILSSGCATKSAVKKALQEDPELLMEVLHEKRFELLDLMQATIQEEQALARQAKMEEAAANPVEPAMRANLVVEGNADAPITIFEYSDFLCPFCVRGHNTMNELLKKYPEKIRVIYKHNPIKKGALGLSALYEAVAAIDPAKATALKDLLFMRQKDVYAAQGQGTVVGDIIKSLGLDVKELQEKAQQPEILEHINADREEIHSFGLDGTPMFIVGGVAVRGAVPVEEFESVIRLVEERTGN